MKNSIIKFNFNYGTNPIKNDADWTDQTSQLGAIQYHFIVNT